MGSDKDVDWAWLGGFMDGEGSFYPILEKRPANVSGHRIAAHASVANTNMAMLEKVVAIVGFGKIKLASNPLTSSFKNRKRSWKVVYRGPQLAYVIPGLLPYLTGSKKEAAKLALELSYKIHGIRRHTQEWWEEAMEIYNKLRAINKRGTDKYQPSFVNHVRAYKNIKGKCSIGGCDRSHYGRGMCSMHWKRVYRREKSSQLSLVAGGA